MWLNRLKELLFSTGDVSFNQQGAGERLKSPSTLAAELEKAPAERPIVFDPALMHFQSAQRAGEPQFLDSDIAATWTSIRFAALDHILRRIVDSEYAQHLVLRGSAVMTSWFPEHARNPGDLDWVVTPPDWRGDEPAAKRLIDSIVNVLRGSNVDGKLRIPDVSFAMEEIWTYEKAPGIRIIVPWTFATDGIFDGTVQLDFVFGEVVPSPNVTTTIRFPKCGPIDVKSASQEQSLAWKLVWLCTDSHAMGKDLYDAVLLAESTPLSMAVLEETFRAAETDMLDPLRSFTFAAMQNLHVEWQDFKSEFPDIPGGEQEWKDRLAIALTPVFDTLDRN